MTSSKSRNISPGTLTESTKAGEERAQFYLKKHKILELLENITSALVYERPDNPKTFIIDYIEKLKESRNTSVNYPTLFDESNVKSIFGMMDTANKGFINHSQYKSGMENLGVSTYDRKPPGTENDCIDVDTFVHEANEGIVKATATFA
ncbi:EF-hand calcium-binding domain-containing protein 10-like [Hydractinia symbiolongicarpus]|uniref:EF-hand calcium-binding domain-containing protein 10-like n=1 Tax=Hydractinia symbiolongicarpus TaxID=13093 RepID=UPI00254D6203|nr:EF-hand calcium-binding domain-containing protein 10-like [Hydractinia symbiolongicarpus]XP_057313999.1 EF-hand calcium-binding domain-containing protein 10-like [Hydractinia symbiolongicarpus]